MHSCRSQCKRDYHIFEKFAYRVMADVRKCSDVEIFKFEDKVWAFNSTMIGPCLSLFNWVLLSKAASSFMLSMTLRPRCLFFPYNAFQTAQYKSDICYPVRKNLFYIFDCAYNDFRGFRTISCVVAYFMIWDKKFIFFINALDISSLKVTGLYRNQWQIGLFFK